jgi:nucleotide-binding universal stress UspA family protein
MTFPRRTIVGFDFSAGSRQALRLAAAWARITRSRVTVVHALPAPYVLALPVPELAALPASFEGREKAELARLEQAAGGLGECRVVFGSPAAAILETAEREKADLIVVGSNRSGVARLLLGSVAETVAREASCAVLLARGTGSDPRRPILVGVDLSPHSRAALRVSLALGKASGASVHAVHVLPRFADTVSRRDDARAAYRKSRRQHEEALERLLRGTGITAAVREGDAADEILRAATGIRAGLVVVARRGQTISERILMGSVVTRVLRRAALPVLVVPPAGVPRAVVPKSRRARRR